MLRLSIPVCVLILCCIFLIKEYFTGPRPLSDWVYEEVVKRYPCSKDKYVQISD